MCGIQREAEKKNFSSLLNGASYFFTRTGIEVFRENPPFPTFRPNFYTVVYDIGEVFIKGDLIQLIYCILYLILTICSPSKRTKMPYKVFFKYLGECNEIIE